MAEPAQRQQKRNFRSFIWDSDTHLKTPEERTLLRKLDFSILTIGCIGFFLKYLDQSNLANAYVSGMQEDLAMYGNQYTYAGTAYTCAYAVMQIPSTLIIQHVRPSYWLGLMEIGWGAFTFAQAGMSNYHQLYAFRFLVGFFESSWFPCMLFVMGSWYTKTELAKRIALFHMASPVGSAASGYLQAAVYDSLDGVHGLAGWRWLYVICGCMTVPVGLVTFLFLPDTPYQTRAWFLTQNDKNLALRRVEEAGKAAPANLTWKKAGRILRGWKWWLFVLGYVLYGSSCQNSSYFAIWLKSAGFSVDLRNIIPTGTSLISGFCVVMWGFLADYTGSRVTFVLIPLIYGLLPTGILAFWPSSLALKEFAFLTAGVQLMTAVFYTWASEVCANDNEERALVIGSMNGFQYAVAAWLPIVTFPQLDAPTFRKGFPSTFGLDIAAIICVLVTQWFVVHDAKRKTSDLATSNTQTAAEETEGDNDLQSDDKAPSKRLDVQEKREPAQSTLTKLLEQRSTVLLNLVEGTDGIPRNPKANSDMGDNTLNAIGKEDRKTPELGVVPV